MRLSIRPLAFAIVLGSSLPAAVRADDSIPPPRPPALAPAPAPAPEPKLESIFVELGGLDEPKGAVVEKAVTQVKGVRSWTWVTRVTDAKVVREAGTADDATLLAAAKAAGATTVGVVPIASVALTFVDALHCGGCVRTVTTALRAIAAVKEVEINDTRTIVTIRHDSRTGKVAEFVKVLADAERPVVAPK